MRRLAQLLLPVPPPLPLPLWRGNGSIHTVPNDTTTKVIASGMLSLMLVRDPAVGFRVVLEGNGSTGPVLEIVAERRIDGNTLEATAVITQAEHSLVHAALIPSSGHTSNTVPSAADFVWKAAGSALALPAPHASLLGLVAAGNTNAGTLGVIAGHISYGDATVPPVALCLPDTAPCRSHVQVHVHLPSTASTEDLLQALVARRMPSEIALQARGMGGPRVLLRGGLRLYRAGLLRVGWDALRFELRSNGALQWFAEDSQAPESSGSNAYFWRPKGGVSLAQCGVLSHPTEVSTVARLRPDAIRQHNVLAVTIKGAIPRTLVLSAPSPADKSAWVQALTRTAALMGGGSTPPTQAMLPATLPDDLREAALLLQVPSAVSALAAAQDALWSATQGGSGGASRRAAVPSPNSESSEADLLQPADVPAQSSHEVLLGRGSATAEAPLPAASSSQSGVHFSSATRSASSSGTGAAQLRHLRWGSVEDLYRLQVPAGGGGGGGQQPNAHPQRQAHSPVLQEIASMCSCSPSVLVSNSLFSLSLLQSALAFSAAAGGEAWRPALHSSSKRLLWGAMAHLWHTPVAELESRLRGVGCLPPTLAQGLRHPAEAVPISEGRGGALQAAPTHPIQTGGAKQVSTTKPDAWPTLQPGNEGAGLRQVRAALQEALSAALFAALDAAANSAVLYMDQPRAAFSLLVSAAEEVDEWLGQTALAHGSHAGNPTRGRHPPTADDAWYPLSEQRKVADCKNGVLRRHHFVTLTGCFFELLADPFSGGAVFDALVEDTLPITMQVRQATHDGRSSTVHITERVMTFDTFQQYISFLAGSVLHPPAVWDTLHSTLRLDPREILVRLEEGVHCVISARAEAPIQQAPPLPTPQIMLPALLGMPTADSVVHAIRTCSALLPEGHSKAWTAMHAPAHKHLSLMPPKHVMLAVLQQLPVNVGRAREALRVWMRSHAGADMMRIWPQALQARTSAGQHKGGDAAPRMHRSLMVPYSEQDTGAAVETTVGGGEQGLPPSDVQVPLLGAVKRAPLGLSFIQWRRRRRRIARAYQISRKVSLQQAAAATGGRRQLKAARPDKTATSELQHEISNMFSAKRLGAQTIGEQVDSSSDSSEGDTSSLSRKQRALLQLLPPPGQGDSGDYTTVTSNTDDSFGESSDEEADLRWLQNTLVPGLEAGEGAQWGQVDEELLELLHSPIGRKMVQAGSASVRVSGKLLITDRSAYLVCSANEVLVLPLRSLGHMEYCTTAGTTMGNTMDNGLHLSECDLRRVARDESLDSDGEPSQLKLLFTLAQVVARPSAAQLRTLHVFRWQLAVEEHLAAYYSAPSASDDSFITFPSATDDVFARELGMGSAAANTRESVHHHIGQTHLELGAEYDESPQLRMRGGTSSRSESGAVNTPPQVVRYLSGNRSVISMRSSTGDSSASRTAVRADAAMAASIGVLRAVWDCVQGFAYSATFNGAFGQPQMLLPGSVTPSCTLVFSKLKDFVLGQGEERIGGRRRVVREALEELAAAHMLTPALGISSRQVWTDLVQELGWGVDEIARGKATRLRDFSKWLKLRLVKPVRDDQAAACRLVASCALNLIRTRALLKCTGRCSQSLLYSTAVLRRLRGGRSGLPAALQPRAGSAAQAPSVEFGFKVHQSQLHDLAEAALFPVAQLASAPSANLGAAPTAGASDTGSTSAASVLLAEYAAQCLPAELVAEEALLFMTQQSEPHWLLRSVGFVTRCEQLQVVRDAQLAVFDRAVMTHQWRVLSSLVLKPYQTTRAFIRYTLKWENPPLTFSILLGLLLLAWWDVLLYIPAMALSFGALGVLVWGGLKPAQRKWLHSVLSEPPKRSENLNWMQRYRHTTKVLGKVQFKLHKQLLRWQRLLAVLSWKSPSRTRLFMLLLLVAAAVLCVVPFRLLFVLVVLGQFSKPLRDNASGLSKLALGRFLQGLPLPSLSAAVYAETPASALSSVPEGSIVQTLSSLQGEELAQLGDMHEAR